MSDYVCPPIGSIKKERVRRVRASISQPTPMPLARQLDRSFRCQFAASGFGANPTWIDGGRRLELRAQVSLSTRRNGVPGNEHDAKSWGARPAEGRSLIQVAAAPPSLPPANGNSLPHARGQRVVFLRSWLFRSFSGSGFFDFLSGFWAGLSGLIYYLKSTTRASFIETLQS